EPVRIPEERIGKSQENPARTNARAESSAAEERAMSQSSHPDQARAFRFIRVNERAGKPRARRVTEIGGPYHTPMGQRYLRDILETMGAYVDALKFAGGSFSLMPRRAVKELIDLCHEHDVLVSTGGFIEYVLTQGADIVHRYVRECKELGFDIVEV